MYLKSHSAKVANHNIMHARHRDPFVVSGCGWSVLILILWKLLQAVLLIFCTATLSGSMRRMVVKFSLMFARSLLSRMIDLCTVKAGVWSGGWIQRSTPSLRWRTMFQSITTEQVIKNQISGIQIRMVKQCGLLVIRSF